MTLDRDARIRRLVQALPTVSDALLVWIDRVVEAMAKSKTYSRLPSSDFVDDRFLADFGDTLRLHHVFSNEPFSKDKFEYAMEWVANAVGRSARLAKKGNPGHDITIDNVTFSLKTEAAKGIKETELHISKFMELGKGKWDKDEKDLVALREQFFAHMRSYERILSLRYLKHDAPEIRYELVEIPKALLARAATGTLTMMHDSKQMPRPGYCHVREGSTLLFELYFDGGTERKLQVRKLRKDRCVVHADWRFAR